MPPEIPSVPKAPKPCEPMSLMMIHAWSPVPLGVLSGTSGGTGFRAGSLVGPGMSWRAGPLLPAAGPASALLHRVGAEQGSKGAIRWSPTTLHLEVGSQGSVMARASLWGGQGIWKESRRVGLGSTQRLPVSKGCTMPSKDRASYSSCIHSHIHSFIHSCIYPFIHPLIHSFILQQMLTKTEL